MPADTETNWAHLAREMRPNTHMPLTFFQDNMVICTGEDPAELWRAIQTVFPGQRPPHHKYRVYEAWKLPGVTIVISGIGTGSTEPLMWELLDYPILGYNRPKRLTLIGTAGYISDFRTSLAPGFGRVFVVSEAYPVGCAVRISKEHLPLRPKFAGIEELGLPMARELSTDRYFTCTPSAVDARKIRAMSFDPQLGAEIDEHWKPGRLISMETVPFYHFAEMFGLPDTEYVAFRGVANIADQFATQADYSEKVLADTLRHAVNLLLGRPAK